MLAAILACSVGRGYVGVDVVERPEGLMVWRVLPGPLDGDFVSSASLARGDLVVAVDGAPATRELWDALADREIGSSVRIDYRLGEPRGPSGAAKADGERRTVEIKIDDAQLWRGFYKSGELPEAPALGARPAADATELRDGIAHLGADGRARAEALAASLARVPAEHGDPGTAPLLRAMFARPAAIEGLARAAIPAADGFAARPFSSAAQLVARLAGDPGTGLPEPHGTFKIEHADAGIWYLDFLLNGARARFAESVPIESGERTGLRPLVVERLDELLVRGPNSRDAMTALKSLSLFEPMRAAAVLAHFEVTEELSPAVGQGEAAELPDALKGAVEGKILAASEIAELGWVVVGGLGPNTYDLGRVAAVLDLGGDERYDWNHARGQHRLVVDLGGDDVHRGGLLGPAGALGAIALIDDRAGNDRYEGGALTAGCALGLSAIIDRAGDDVYQGGSWSLGAAAGGAAVVIDLAGSDRIEGEGMAIGVGGPRGVGAFVDLAGDDVAVLGTRPSVYGVAGEHAGFGMGFGFGFRLAAAGGVGAYLDYAGRDQRRSGEFSQGCGYYLGVGVLFDGSGDDVASCDRYGLGSAAHQAIGVLLDDGGNDSYHGRTAAHVGAAWDESCAFFADRAGDDSYRTDVLSLGAAAQQALGMAIDRGGADQYRAGSNCLGAASTNEYHFAASGLGSFGLFLDLAGVDLYPDGRANDRTVVSADAPAASLRDQDGVFADSTPVQHKPAK